MTSPKQALVYLGNLGSALPSALSLHRGNFVLKRAAATEDELYVGVKDATGANKLRQITTKDSATSFTDLSVSGIFDDSSSNSYVPTVGAAMGTSPGSITQVGNEYCGRLTQTTGSTGTTTGILWTVAFANARPSSEYNVFLNPQNSDSAGLDLYAVNDSNSQFTIRCKTAPGTSVQIRIGWWIVQR